jgi:hypothetical protein
MKSTAECCSRRAVNLLDLPTGLFLALTLVAC